MKIIPKTINGEVNIPSSKSVLHRLIIISALSDKVTKINCTDFGLDIFHTIDCINKLGGFVETYEGYLMVHPIKKPVECEINVGESGSTLRFLMPIIASLSTKVIVDGENGIKARPVDTIVDLFLKNNIKVSSNKLPLEIEGKLTQGDYEIDGSISSQFATGMLIALSFIQGKSTLRINNPTSEDYLNITVDSLRQFGVKIEKKDKYYIESNGLISPGEVNAEGDFSSASFIMALGALSGKVILHNLNVNSSQGDKIIVDVLKDMGGNVEVNNDSIVVAKSELKATTFDLKNYPDMAPILSVLMAQANGVSTLTNVDRLKIKESDRLANIIDMLTRLKIKTEYSSNTLKIFGGKFSCANLLDHNDHRICMSSIVALNIASGTISDTKCIDKSYPQFLEDFKKIGGCYE